MWFKYGLKAQKLLAQGAWSKLAYILSIEALSTVQIARFTISVFAVLLLSQPSNRQTFYCCLNLSSSESPEDEGGRGWCSMCSYILAHFKNRAVFNTKFFHGSEYLGCWYFKISLSALISKYQCGLVYLNYLVFLIGVTAICLDSLNLFE